MEYGPERTAIPHPAPSLERNQRVRRAPMPFGANVAERQQWYGSGTRGAYLPAEVIMSTSTKIDNPESFAKAVCSSERAWIRAMEAGIKIIEGKDA